MTNERVFRDVFELTGVPDIGAFYREKVFVWKSVYQGYYEPWHLISAPTVADPRARRELFRLNAAKALCRELSSLVWSEMCAVRVGVPGREDLEERVNACLQEVFRENGLPGRMGPFIEKCLALGSGAVKVWPEGGRVRIGLCGADQFVPLSWRDGKITEGLFISRFSRGGKNYTRLEWHTLRDGGAYVRTETYASEPGEDILGRRVEAGSAERVPFGGPLFTCVSVPFGGGEDIPLGQSLFGGALGTLRALDICFDSFVREFRLGKKRLIVPSRAVRSAVDPATGEMRRFFDAEDEAWEALTCDDAQDLKVEDNTPGLRVQEHVDALNALLGILCVQTGFSAGAFSFEKGEGLRTATEVVSENSKTFKTVRSAQNRFAEALEEMTRRILSLAAGMGLLPGEVTECDLRVKAVFDDGITQDRQTTLKEGVTLVGAGLLSRERFLTDPRYGQGMTEEEARREIGRIRNES